MTPIDPVLGVERTEPQTMVQFLFKSGAQFQILMLDDPKSVTETVFAALTAYREAIWRGQEWPIKQYIRLQQWVKEKEQYSECIISLEDIANVDISTATKRPPDLAVPGSRRQFGV
jgi:hypothetical protein